MAVPKTKKSKSKKRMRKAAIRKPCARAQSCEQCGADKLAHRVCPSCGYYRGRQVVTISDED